LLDDPICSVRISATKQILDISTQQLSNRDQLVVETAIGEYQASLSALADFPEVQLNLASVAQRLGDRKLVEKSLLTATVLDPQLTEAWFRLALYEIEAQRFDRAKQYLERAIAQVPGSSVLYQLLGRVHVQLNDESSALHAFEKAVASAPKEVNVHVEYASLLSKLGYYSKSIDKLNRVNHNEQPDPEVLYLLAFNHLQLGDKKSSSHLGKILSEQYPKSDLNERLKIQTLQLPND
jgi:predicted Zn-dependent protease